MGINAGSYFTYRSRPLQFVEVLRVIRERHEKHVALTGITRKPTVDFDANQLGFKLCHAPQLGGAGPAGNLFAVAQILSESGCNVQLVCDPPTRHHSKRATIERGAEREKNRLLILSLQNRLALLMQQKNEGADVAEADIKTLEKRIISAQKSVSVSLPLSFFEQLKDFVATYVPAQPSHGSIDILIDESGGQADIVIAKRAFEYETDLIWSSDGDFLGMLGAKACCVKDFKFGCIARRGTKQVHSLVLSAAASSVTQEWSRALKWDTLETNVIVPSHPVFEEDNLHLRALAAVTIGSDVWRGGVPHVGAAAVYKILKELPNGGLNNVEIFVSKIVSESQRKNANGIDARMLKCYADAFLFERTAAGTFHGSDPEQLERYLYDFKVETTTITNELPTKLCIGFGKGMHEYLECEGDYVCFKCFGSLCRHCKLDHMYHGGSETEQACFGCAFGISKSAKEYPTACVMRERLLKERFIQVPKEGVSPSQLMALFDMHLRDDDDDHFTELIQSVKYPLVAPSSLDDNAGYLVYKTKCLVSQLAFQLQDRSWTIDDIVSFTNLLASFVQMSDCPGHQDHKVPLEVTQVLPQMMVKVANDSRIHSGERILRRAVRNAMDPATPDIMGATARIARRSVDGDLAIVLQHRVRASMKSTVYTTTVAVTSQHLIACKCGCKCGATDSCNFRVLDVHPLSVIYQMSILLHDGLSENILVELKNRLESTHPEILNTTEGQFYKDVHTLVGATKTKKQKVGNVGDLLSAFTVGTSQSRLVRGRPNPKDLGLLYHKKYIRPTTKAKMIIDEKATIEENTKVMSDEPDWDDPTKPFFKVDYDRVSLMIDAINLMFQESSYSHLLSKDVKSPIGYRLVYKRKTDDPENFVQRMNEVKKVANQLRYLLTMKSTDRCWTKTSIDLSGLDYYVEPNDTDTISTITGASGLGSSNEGTIETDKPAATVKSHKKCCVFGCTSVVNLTAVPRAAPKRSPGEVVTTAKQVTDGKKNFVRKEVLRRLGLGECLRRDEDYRYCKLHPFEAKTFPIRIPIYKTIGDKNPDSRVNKSFHVNVPIPISRKGSKAEPTTVSKGIGFDRARKRSLSEIESDSHAMACQQILEMNDIMDGSTSWDMINGDLCQAAGLEHHKKLDAVTKVENRVRSVPRNKPAPRHKRRRKEYRKESTINFNELTPKEVYRRTGFVDLKAMLSYMAVVTNGDFSLMTKTSSTMTWMEEWLFFFEMIYGRTALRWSEHEKCWCIGKKTLRKALRCKLDMVLEARISWPMYATVAEDNCLRNKDTWDWIFPEDKALRIFFHDSTNVALQKPTDADLQRALHNDYYGMACGKGGVAIQQCGWIRTYPLMTGGIGDSEYVVESEILKKQAWFASQDTSSTRGGINAMDKGYRTTLVAQTFGQSNMQPAFADSDRKFTSEETLYSAAIAALRSGNERAVHVVKMSWFITKTAAIQSNPDLKFISKIWLAFGFQSNFMYQPVH